MHTLTGIQAVGGETLVALAKDPATLQAACDEAFRRIGNGSKSRFTKDVMTIAAAHDVTPTGTHAPVIPATVVKAAAPKAARTPRKAAAKKAAPKTTATPDQATKNRVWKAAFDGAPDQFRRRSASRAQAALYAGLSETEAILVGIQHGEDLALDAMLVDA